MQDDEDIDYRNLLAASSEEDLVLFEKDLWTGGGSSSLAHVKRKRPEIENRFDNWSDKLVSNVISLFHGRKEKQHPPESETVVENDETKVRYSDQPLKSLILNAAAAPLIGSQDVETQDKKQDGIWSNAQAGIGRFWFSAKPKSKTNNDDCVRLKSLVSIDSDTADCSTSDHDASAESEVVLHSCIDQSPNFGESWPGQSADENKRDIDKGCNSLVGNECAENMPGKYNYTAMDNSQVDIGESEELDPLFGGNRKSSDVYYKGRQRTCRKRLLASMLIILILGVAIGCGIAVGLIYGRDSESEPSPRTGYVYREAAVAADAARCSEVGRDILLNRGSAMDAAIAGLLCVGLFNAHSAGIGGGSFIMYYDRETETPSFLNSREVAPLLASTDMYTNESSDASTVGGLAIAVPGEVMGYWEAHQRFGKLPWADLFEPSIEIAEQGFTVGPALANAIDSQSDRIMVDPNLREIMLDENGDLLKEGGTMYRRKLAQTMRTLAAEGAAAFYNGSMAATIVAEIAESGKNQWDRYGFSPESLQSIGDETLTYHRIIEAFKFAYAKRSALGDADFVDVEEVRGNTTGIIYNNEMDDFSKPGAPNAYGVPPSPANFILPGKRPQSSMTPVIMVDDDGDVQFVVGASGGTRITTATSLAIMTVLFSPTLPSFGSKVRGNTTGIIYNNEMDDFSKPGAPNAYGVPPSPANFILPGKRPQSSMTPVIMVDDDGDVQFVVGASGGTRITTATSLITMESLWFGSSLQDGVERRRVHNQLLPNATRYEPGFPQDVIDGLIPKGQYVEESTSGAVVQVIKRLEDGWVEGYCDSRKDGKPSGF
eukprot:XP_011660551.1 PREDICTED: gamma-glutamyltranspeptidase 1 [Strongylocentrotus purpuratus]